MGGEAPFGPLEQSINDERVELSGDEGESTRRRSQVSNVFRHGRPATPQSTTWSDPSPRRSSLGLEASF